MNVEIPVKRPVLLKVAPWLTALGPAIYTSYLFFSRWPVTWATTFTDWLFLVFGVGVGALGVAFLPIREWAKMVLVSIYVPVVGVALFGWTFGFLCGAFELCL